MLKKRFHKTAGAAIAASAVSFAFSALGGVSGCTTLPEPKLRRYEFPKGAYVGAPEKRPYEKLGQVRTKVNFSSLDPQHEENVLCRNFYNKAAADLLKMSREQGGDAVIDVKSVVFMMDGSHEIHPEPECSDDGSEGQILLQGIAIKWLPKPSKVRDPLLIEGEPQAVPSPGVSPAPEPGKLPAAPPAVAPSGAPSANHENYAPFTTRTKRP